MKDEFSQHWEPSEIKEKWILEMTIAMRKTEKIRILGYFSKNLFF